MEDRPELGERKANAARIVACVNACEGIDTEHLEGITIRDVLRVHGKADDAVKAERDALRAEVARLREALRAMLDMCPMDSIDQREAVERNARAALGGGK